MIRIVLPFHLRNLAGTGTEVQVEANQPTLGAALTALENQYPVLRGTIRDHDTLKRRPLVRFFACKEDISNEPPDTRLPEAISNGTEPLMIVGAMAGG
jgi:molybdopterin synthase sulfur carrier subunit